MGLSMLGLDVDRLVGEGFGMGDRILGGLLVMR